MVRGNIKLHLQRLNAKKIVIEEKYLQEGNDSNIILTRTSNFEKNDNITKCPRIEKNFFRDGEKIHTQKNFDRNIKYTYVSNKNPEEVVECPNCGYKDKSKKFVLGCPYCETDFCVEIIKKNENIKDIVIKDTTIFCIIILFLAVAVKSNLISLSTFIYFIMIIGILEFIAMFFQFLFSSKRKDIWHECKTIGLNINEHRLYNDLYIELSNYYYDEKNQKHHDLVDFDIVEYTEATYDKEDKETYIILSYAIRKYYYVEKHNYIRIVEGISKVKLLRNIRRKYHQPKKFASKCNNCGSQMEINALKCPYCGSKNDSTMAWTIKEIITD